MVNAVFHSDLSKLRSRLRGHNHASHDTVVRLSPSQPRQVGERLAVVTPSSSTGYVVVSWISCLSVV